MFKTDYLFLLVCPTCANSSVPCNFVDSQTLQDQKPPLHLRKWKDLLERKYWGAMYRNVPCIHYCADLINAVSTGSSVLPAAGV